MATNAGRRGGARRPVRADGGDDDVRAILDGLRRLVRFVQSAAVETRQTVGITAAQLWVLQNLRASPGCSLNELAARVYADQSTVSVVVSRLAAQGLVSRRRSSSDRRFSVLNVTAKGQALLDRSVAARAPQIGLLAGIRRLPPDVRRRFAQSLREFSSVVGLDAEPPIMLGEDDRRGRRR